MAFPGGCPPPAWTVPTRVTAVGPDGTGACPRTRGAERDAQPGRAGRYRADAVVTGG